MYDNKEKINLNAIPVGRIQHFMPSLPPLQQSYLRKTTQKLIGGQQVNYLGSHKLAFDVNNQTRFV